MAIFPRLIVWNLPLFSQSREANYREQHFLTRKIERTKTRKRIEDLDFAIS
jgi:hypothetical protein